jgi:hypothetical protein
VSEVFEIIGQISETETIAVTTSIRELKSLRELFGRGRWRKLKGMLRLNCKMVELDLPNCIGMKRMASAKEK